MWNETLVYHGITDEDMQRKTLRQAEELGLTPHPVMVGWGRWVSLHGASQAGLPQEGTGSEVQVLIEHLEMQSFLVKINILHMNMLILMVLFKKRKKGILTLSFNTKLLALLLFLSA